METKKLYFMDCHLAGRMYHDADEAWEGLKVGTLVRLERELDNRHDPNAWTMGAPVKETRVINRAKVDVKKR